MVGGHTYFEINLQREQRINELKTLYTIDELINHCYDEEQEVERLNNIIDELELYLRNNLHDLEYRCYFNLVLDKLKELKGSDTSER